MLLCCAIKNGEPRIWQLFALQCLSLHHLARLTTDLNVSDTEKELLSHNFTTCSSILHFCTLKILNLLVYIKRIEKLQIKFMIAFIKFYYLSDFFPQRVAFFTSTLKYFFLLEYQSQETLAFGHLLHLKVSPKMTSYLFLVTSFLHSVVKYLINVHLLRLFSYSLLLSQSRGFSTLS